MHEWNVVISVRGDCYRLARRLLKDYGTVHRTDYYNVLTLQADDIAGFLEQLAQAVQRDPALGACLARVIPVTHGFTFQSAAELESQIRRQVRQYLPALAGRGFHVRMHRRGFRSQLSGQALEQSLDRFLLEALEAAGTPGHITFDDPDAVVAVETIGQQAGLSLWRREELERYPFIRVD